MKTELLPSLNGWRAVSILLVLGGHTTAIKGLSVNHLHFWYSVFGGDIGVRFFFAISGLLITWLMLKEETEFRRVNVKNFYIRRTLRIWPAYLTYVALLAVFQLSGIVSQHAYAWRGILTFTRNLYDTQLTFDPTGRHEDLLSFHFWSLSVEEQFYLFWPLLFCMLKMRWRICFLVFTILFSLVFQTVYFLGFYSAHHVVLFQDVNTFNFLDCLAWGCLGAILLLRWKDGLEKMYEKFGTVLFSVAVSMIAVPWAMRLGKGISNMGFAILLLHSVVKPDWIFYRPLNFRWMKRVGVLSYSIYIWQQAIWILWPKILLPVWFLWIPMVFGIAWISYEFLEKPFLALRAKFHDPHMTVPLAMSRHNL